MVGSGPWIARCACPTVPSSPFDMLALEQRLSFTATRVASTPSATPSSAPEPLRHLDAVLRLGKLRPGRSIASLCEVPRTRGARFVQLAKCFAELVWSFRAPLRRALIFGEGFRYLSGRVEISSRSVTLSALRSIARKCPFVIVYSEKRRPLADLCAALHVDRTRDLATILSYNGASVFFAELEGKPVIVHAHDSAEKLEISKHRTGLTRASQAIRNPALRALLPTPIKQVSSGGLEVFIQSRLPGEPFASDTTQARLEEQVRGAMQPLLALRAARSMGASLPDVELFAALPSLLERFPRYAAELRTAIDALNQWPRSHLAPVLVHGDYWMENLLFLEDGRRLSGIVDWDCVREAGCSGYDAVHLILLAGSTCPARSLNACLEEVWTKQWKNDFLPRMLEEITHTFDLRPGDVEYLTGLIWLTRLHQREGSRDHSWQYHQIYLPAIAFNRSARYSYGAYSPFGETASEPASPGRQSEASRHNQLSRIADN